MSKADLKDILKKYENIESKLLKERDFSIDLYDLNEEEREFIDKHLVMSNEKFEICNFWCAFHGPIYTGPLAGAQHAINKHKKDVIGLHAIRHFCDHMNDYDWVINDDEVNLI